MPNTELGGLIDATGDRLVRRLAGLSDAEYFWEPVDACWTVRQRPDGVWTPDLGPHGTTWTPAVPPPVTTIAWRLWHIGASPTPSWPPTSVSSARAFADKWFNPPAPADSPGIATAGAAIDVVARHWNAVGAMVGSFADEELLEPIGDVGGAFKDSAIFGLILHVLDELIHHSAEIALLRDLFGAGGPVAASAR